ncbi:tRNA-dihydrouridine(20a/20b) synthase [NAD(P)+]-like protein [Chytridiales sp. JEL 0842]|nr:tRNA-dihydrouridine(20a/20b) synthase [NAD(P)+]-like protein [Chytridiales sp. JEL 0842]
MPDQTLIASPSNDLPPKEPFINEGVPFPRTSVLDLLAQKKKEGSYLKIAAPMVRYSKIAFREVVRKYGTDVAYTPMILSDVFKNSEIARESEFRTNAEDDPVVVQFAASKPEDMAQASAIVARWCSGVDLNCGCPQKWAIHEGIGCGLMTKPELIHSIVRATKSTISTLPYRLSNGEKPSVSVKIRVHKDLKQTIELLKCAERAGADWVTVHGRLRETRSSEPVNLDAIKTVKEHASVPIFANGDIFTLADADRTIAYTNCDGVMAARGLLENPALFAGEKHTPLKAVEEYLRLAIGYGNNHFIMHHHLMYMLDSSMTRAEKRRFNALGSVASVLDFMEEHYGITYNERPRFPWLL